MTVQTASTVLAWVIVALVMLGAVTAVVLRRTAAKILAVAVTGMLVLTLVAARQAVDDIGDHQLAALCAGNASFLGIPLSAGNDADCPAG